MKRARVVVVNSNKKHGISEKFVREIAIKILDIIRRPRAELEIAFLSDSAIRPINKKYKHSDRATDVLSFDLGTSSQILISSDTALRNSGRFGTTFVEELVLYVIHGILHLFGYDDSSAKERLRMSKREQNILRQLCNRANLSKVLTRR